MLRLGTFLRERGTTWMVSSSRFRMFIFSFPLPRQRNQQNSDVSDWSERRLTMGRSDRGKISHPDDDDGDDEWMMMAGKGTNAGTDFCCPQLGHEIYKNTGLALAPSWLIDSLLSTCFVYFTIKSKVTTLKPFIFYYFFFLLIN